MSTTPNAYGNFLGNAAPFVSNYPAIISPWGTYIKPGGRVAAYVRSTGAQDGEDHFAASGMLVASINEGLKRCRSGQNDIVYVLPGHTEAFSASGAIWANLVAGAQIIGCGTPGATNAPNITLSNVGATIAINVANVTICGMNLNTATAAVTGFLAITAAGFTLAGNSIVNTGTGGANSLIAITGAANCTLAANSIVSDSTSPIISVTGAGSTNVVIAGNFIRQAQATGGGASINVASTAGISGMVSDNRLKTATTSTAGVGVFIIGAAAALTVGNFENYGSDESVAGALLCTGA